MRCGGHRLQLGAKACVTADTQIDLICARRPGNPSLTLEPHVRRISLVKRYSARTTVCDGSARQAAWMGLIGALLGAL